MHVEYENTKGYLDKSSLDLISVSTAGLRHRRRALTALALVGCPFFGIMLLALVESLQSQVPRWSLWILFGMPDVAGASGATIRVLRDNWQQGAVILELRPVTMTVALGF
jgi:hypothetical protein